MTNHYSAAIAAVLLACALSMVPVCCAQQQTVMSKDELQQVTGMLRVAYEDVKKYYYDPKLQGVNWDARYAQYSDRVAKARNLGEGFRVVVAFLSGLKDSHTFFVPPSRANRFDYGYRLTLVGNDCFITKIRPKTDAESKLHIGDRVVKMDGFDVNRKDFHDLSYYMSMLVPQNFVEFDLQSPVGESRQLVVNASTKATKKTIDLTRDSDFNEMMRRADSEDHVTRDRFVESGDVTIWKLPEFSIDVHEVEKVIGNARKHKAFILDLRGNPGGAISTLEYIVGSLFDHDVKICDRAGKKNHKPMIAKSLGKPFEGKLIVLVDSGSASCSELLARTVQLQHRGTVIGDKTAGAVMESTFYTETQGADVKIFYGFSVTEANLIMGDGQSLEKTGVTPDELLLPAGADLAAGRDPVLAHAAEEAGAKLDAVAAGKLFPFEWLPL